jgi:hypothetical protein
MDPFAPLPAASGTPSATHTVPCSSCGAPVDAGRAAYSEAGGLLCRRCEALETIDSGEQRAISGIVGAGLGAIGIGLVAIAFNPCLIFSFLAVSSGIAAIAVLMRHPEYKPKMGARYGLALSGAIVGIVLGFTAPVLQVLLLAAIAMLSRM